MTEMQAVTLLAFRQGFASAVVLIAQRLGKNERKTMMDQVGEGAILQATDMVMRPDSDDPDWALSYVYDVCVSQKEGLDMDALYRVLQDHFEGM